MVYNNFILRLLFSLIFILSYLVLTYINFGYVFYLILLIYFLILIETLIYFKKYLIIPIIYIVTSFLFFISIDFNKDIFLSFNLFILTVITFDVFSYITGKVFGKNKFIKISPNKTIEGLLGGFIFSSSLSFSFSYFIYNSINKELFTLVILTIISAFFGDLIESFYKRKNNLKNSSEFIPGHGGVFDRFDSFLFSIIIYSIFLQY